MIMVEEEKNEEDDQGRSLVQALITLFLTFDNPVCMVYFESTFLAGRMQHYYLWDIYVSLNYTITFTDDIYRYAWNK